MAIKLKVCVRPRALLPLLLLLLSLSLQPDCGFGSTSHRSLAFVVCLSACLCMRIGQLEIVVAVACWLPPPSSAPSARAPPLRISRDSYLFVAFKLFISIALYFFFFASLLHSFYSAFYVFYSFLKFL